MCLSTTKQALQIDSLSIALKLFDPEYRIISSSNGYHLAYDYWILFYKNHTDTKWTKVFYFGQTISNLQDKILPYIGVENVISEPKPDLSS